MRPSIDETCMATAYDWAKRSTCIARQVGAVAAIDGHVIVTGYNGVVRKAKHPTICLRQERDIPSGKETFLCGCVHAEMNLIIQAARFGHSIEGATVYCTNQPCSLCAIMLINVGIVRVVYDQPYSDEAAITLFKQAGVVVERFDRANQPWQGDKMDTTLKVIVRVRPPYVFIGKATRPGEIVTEYLDREGHWWKVAEGNELPEQCRHLYITGNQDAPPLQAMSDWIAGLEKRLGVLETRLQGIPYWPYPAYPQYPPSHPDSPTITWRDCGLRFTC